MPFGCRQLFRVEHEVDDALEALEALVALLDLGLEQREHLRVREQPIGIVGEVLPLGPRRTAGRSATISATLCGLFSPNTMACAMYGTQLELLLERHGRDVLAVLELVQLLDAAGDVEVAVGVEATEVARAEAAVGRQRFARLVPALVVAAHHVGAVDDDLALVAGRARARLVDLEPHAGDRDAHGAEAHAIFGLRGGGAARLGQAVALVDLDAERSR